MDVEVQLVGALVFDPVLVRVQLFPLYSITLSKVYYEPDNYYMFQPCKGSDDMSAILRYHEMNMDSYQGWVTAR